MKKLLTIAFVAMLFASCADMFLSKEERLVKKHITMYLEENLHDPSSLKDLKIDYAVISDTVHALFSKAIETEDYMPGSTAMIEGKVVAIIEYRAKNAYGAYRKGEDIVIFDERAARLMDRHEVERIEQQFSYVVDFNAFDWKTIPAK